MQISKITWLLLLMLIGLPAAGQSSTDVYQKFQHSICMVEYTQSVPSRSRIGSFNKIKRQQIGLIVSETGLIMMSKEDDYSSPLEILQGVTPGLSVNDHSISFEVLFHDGKRLKADFVGEDDIAQVAFLQVKDLLEAPLKPVVFSASEEVRIGQPIYLIELVGRSSDFTPLFSTMIINAISEKPRRQFYVKEAKMAFSSGGLVVNQAGEAIGITIGKFFSSSGKKLGNKSVRLLEIAPSEWFMELIENPPVKEARTYLTKSWLGISMQSLTPELKAYWKVPAEGGVVLNRILPDSPAERAGLQLTDVLLKLNGKDIEAREYGDLDNFRDMLRLYSPDSTVNFEIFRKGEILTVPVVLGSRPEPIEQAEKMQFSELGLEVRAVTRDVLYNYDLPLDTRGVFVYQVDQASPAALGGLDSGGIISSLNDQPVEDLAGFSRLLKEILDSDAKKMMLKVRFRNLTRFIFIDLD